MGWRLASGDDAPTALGRRLVATALLLVALGVAGATLPALSHARTGTLTAKPQPKAKAAYTRHAGLPGCEGYRSTAAANYDANSAAWQTGIVRQVLIDACMENAATLADVADALGWDATTHGSHLSAMKPDLAAVKTAADTLVEKFGEPEPYGQDGGTGRPGPGLALLPQLDKLRGGLGARDATAGDGTVNGRLATIAGKLDTLHSDLVALKGAVVEQGPNQGAASFPGNDDANPSFVRLASSEQSVTEARDWLRTDLWLGFGLAAGLFFAGRLYRAVSPRA